MPIPLPLLIIAAGALLGLMDVRNNTLDKAEAADTLRDRVDELERALDEARDTGDTDAAISKLQAELAEARRELAGLKAGAEARNNKPENPPAPPVEDTDDESDQSDAGDSNPDTDAGETDE